MNYLVRTSAFNACFKRDYRVVICTAGWRDRNRGHCACSQHICMLGIISRASSIIDSITIDIRTRRATLPGQCQISGVRVLWKQQPCNEEQRRGEPGAGEKLCKTMEFIVNTVVLSTDRADRGTVTPKNAGRRLLSRLKDPPLPVALSASSSGAERYLVIPPE